MVKKLLLGGLLGGLTLFIWLGLSWAALGLHAAGFKELPGLREQAAALSGAEHGVYYSGMPEPGDTAPQVAMMVLLPDGYTMAMPVIMLRGLLLSILAALGVTFIVLASHQPAFRSRVVLCTCIGAVVALAGPLMTGNFFFFTFEFLLPEVIDQLVGWTLAGLVIAWATKPLAPRAVAHVEGSNGGA